MKFSEQNKNINKYLTYASQYDSRRNCMKLIKSTTKKKNDYEEKRNFKCIE